ncbi:RAD26 [Symbiodinium sp. CCMP2456]|nr:RAD26 [Symbiodinium sp. CCMP2456]
MCLTTWVQFRDDKRPSVWRDISNHVKLEWAVAVGDRASGSEPEVLALKDCRRIALEGQRPTQNNSPSIITWEGRVVSLTVKEAEAILKASRESTAPAALGSFALLKAGLGAMPNVLLEKKVQSFFDDPATGLIRVKDVPVPEKLSAILRPYQATGYHWLVNNARNGLGCILADDMGLGKTVQAIALMLFLKKSHMLARPMLVIVPTGLLSNWSRELKKWAGDDLAFQVFHGNCKKLLANARPTGRPAAQAANWICPRCEELNNTLRDACNNCGAPKPPGAIGAAGAAAGAARAAAAPKAAGKGKRARALPEEQSAHIMLTSYGTFRTSAKNLMKEQQFAGIILDEAQNIKNHGTQVAKLVKEMADCCGTVRVALSGTPVENSLADLHSCFEFILPGYLANSKSEFTKEFAKPLAAAARKQDPVPEVAEKQRLLQRLIQPFVMRRLKSDKKIAADLPDKVEQNHDCELSPVQETCYQALQEKGQRDAEGVQGIERRGQVLAMLHALRKVCNHPACLDPEKYPQGTEQIPKSSDIEASGKCAKLHELLHSIIAAEEKVLIFSTYLATISLLKSQIEENFNSKARNRVFVGSGS